MKRTRNALLFITFAVGTLSACASRAYAPVVPRQQENSSAVDTAMLRERAQAIAAQYGVEVRDYPAAPFNGTPSQLHHDTTVSINHNPLSGPPRFRDGNGLHRMSSVGSYDSGGQAGLDIPGGNGYIGIYANNTAYQASQITLNPWDPNEPSNPFNVLYAPTTHGSDGACLENGTDYWNYQNTGTQAHFRVYSGSCSKTGFIVDKPIDSTFVTTYVRVFLNGATPQYTTEVLYTGGAWYSMLYNYSAGQWEAVAGPVTGIWGFNDGEGWSIFETHYTIGPCSKPPRIESTGLRVRSANGTWSLISSLNATTYGPWGSCISSGVSPYSQVTYPQPPQINDPYMTAWWAQSY